MKILLVHNRYRSTQPSGENAVVDHEASLLHDYGCHVERLEVDSDEIDAWPRRKQALLPLQIVWSRHGERSVSAAIRSFEPDIVHFHNTFPLLSPAVLRAAKATGMPVVLTLHNFRPLCAAATFLREGKVCEDCLHSRVPIAAVRHGCYRGSRAASVPLAAMIAVHRQLGTWTDHVDKIIFPSAFARDKYLSAGWPHQKLVVKYNTTDSPGTVRTGPGSGFVAISRLTREKGLDVLIDAWRVAFPNGEQQLSIIGSGDDKDELREHAAGVSGVQFVGAASRRDVFGWLAGARALVVPSRCYETFARTVIEAYSVGVPVVASRIGALAEIVQDERTGLLVEPGSVQELAQSLQRLSSDPALGLSLGAEGLHAYEELFAAAPTMRSLLQVYSGLVHPDVSLRLERNERSVLV